MYIRKEKLAIKLHFLSYFSLDEPEVDSKKS